jgi:hypothetical protein
MFLFGFPGNPRETAGPFFSRGLLHGERNFPGLKGFFQILALRASLQGWEERGGIPDLPQAAPRVYKISRN